MTDHPAGPGTRLDPSGLRRALRRLPACARWTPEALDVLASQAQVTTLPAGAVLIGEGEPSPDWYGIVERGGLRVSRADGESLEILDHLTDGDIVDPGPPGGVAPCTIVAVEPTRWVQVPRAAVAAGRSLGLAAGVELTAGESVSLWTRRVADLVTGHPVTCALEAPIREAAAAMAGRRVGSIVVTRVDGCPVGIVTDRDLARRVVAAGGPADGPVRGIMSSPLVTIDAERPALEALLEMTRRNVRHLAVVASDRLVGVVSSRDVMLLQSAHPVALVREIDEQETVDGLAAAAGRVVGVVRWLLRQGVSTIDLGRIVSELNDRTVRRAVVLGERALQAAGDGGPPLAYSWLAAGSEGRREQTLRTDQDNGLVYADPPGETAASATAYFRRLATVVGENLVRIGFPSCRGGFMASNPQWCQPLSAWKASFASWMDTPRAERLLFACLYFDIRVVAGDDAPGRDLWEWVCERAPRSVLFQRLMAKSAVDHQVPLGLFGRFVVERSGEHRDTLDIKFRGVFPMTQAMRVYALSLGLEETNTVDRLAGAGRRDVFTPVEVGDLREAYEVVSRVRLTHQLARLDAGEPADNFVNPHALGKSDRLLLREAFRSIAELQRRLEDRFQTMLIG